MKILVVLSEELKHYPPVMTLLYSLTDMGHNVGFVARNVEDLPESLMNNKNLRIISVKHSCPKNFIKKILAYLIYKRNVKSLVKKEKRKYDLIWTTTDTTVRELGNILYGEKYVMQLMELIQYLPRYPLCSWIKFPIDRYARTAVAVAVPEYNRAHIQKAWWQLDKLPYILPNKPYVCREDMKEHNDAIRNVEKELTSEKRKIILYQGVFQEERNLRIYAEAINRLNNRYVFYLMGRENAYSRDLLKDFPNVKFINFIVPPLHLRITGKANIGILNYNAVKSNNHISVLNPIYCAPNKVYEYAMFGVPMLGNEIPGLNSSLENNGIGVCHKGDSADDIVRAILNIESNYKELSDNCRKFYQSDNIQDTINTILRTVGE